MKLANRLHVQIRQLIYQNPNRRKNQIKKYITGTQSKVFAIPVKREFREQPLAVRIVKMIAESSYMTQELVKRKLGLSRPARQSVMR